jgi:hypothetical protein
MITTFPKESSAFEKAEYNTATNALHVTFKGGREYLYLGFAPTDWDAFLAADSAGKHFNTIIRNAFTPYRKV